MVSCLSLLLAFWTLRKQVRADRVSEELQQKNLNFQERLTTIEEARRQDEVALRNEADIRFSITTQLDRRGKTYSTNLTLENVGDADARNVIVGEILSDMNGTPIVVDALRKPIPSILSGARMPFQQFVSFALGDVFSVSLSWDDPSGHRNQELIVTRERL